MVPFRAIGNLVLVPTAGIASQDIILLPLSSNHCSRNCISAASLID
jgi:hypothetical protein